MNAEPDDDEHEAGDLLQQELVAEERAADDRSADTERHEDGREAEDERDAGDDDATRRARLAEAVGLDGGDRRQVAGHERQHAGREKGDEPGRRAPGAAPSRSLLEPGELFVDAPARGLRVERLVGIGVALPAPARRLHAHASAPSATAPTASAASGSSPGEQVEPVLRRLGEDAGPELLDELLP